MRWTAEFAFANDLDPPLENIAHGRLARLDSIRAGQDRALDDAANTGDVRDLFAGIDDRAIAGRRAERLDQNALADAAADRAVMNVHLTDGDGNAGGQAELFGPCGAERTGGNRRVVSLRVKAIAQSREARIEQREEFLVGQTAPFVAIKCLVTRRADTALDGLGITHAREHRRDVVAQFQPSYRPHQKHRARS